VNKLGRILITDDEETFLNSTADLLRREGYECDCASDAETAIGMLKTSRYDLLIVSQTSSYDYVSIF
jgi:DNA-binding response OmpR family regulator